MAPPTKEKKAAENAVAQFEVTSNMLKGYVSDNQVVFDGYYDLVGKYNTLNKNARDAVRAINATGFNVGPFRKTNPVQKTTFDPTKLPAEVLKMDNVVTVNADVLEKLIASGEVPFEDVKDARIEGESTPMVKGPVKMQVKVG